jgi:hypothetical protein
MKNGLGNFAATSAGQLAAVVRHRFKRIQYRLALIDGFLAQTEPQISVTAAFPDTIRNLSRLTWAWYRPEITFPLVMIL